MIGTRLKEERERLKLTQPQFGEAAGAAKRTVIEWEKGATSPSTVQLAALGEIGVDTHYVLTGERVGTAHETREEFSERIQAIKTASKFVNALPLQEKDREGLKLTLTGDIEKDAQLVGQFVARSRQGNDTANVASSMPTYSQGRVIPMPLNEHASLTQHEVMTLVLDALHVAQRTLPAIRVYAIVDAIMAWQRAGMTVTESTIVEQLRRVQ